MDQGQAVIVGSLLAVVALLIEAALRHRSALAAMDRFQTEFASLCDDDTVAIEVCENMREVFKISCKWCAATTILSSMLLYKYYPAYRRAVDNRTIVQTKNLRPASARRILTAYEALFDYACYAVPILGGLVRWLIKNVGMRAQKATKPGIFLATGKRIVTPFKWSLVPG